MKNIYLLLKNRYDRAVENDYRRHRRLALLGTSPTLRDIPVSIAFASQMHGITEDLLREYISRGYLSEQDGMVSLFDIINLNIVNINLDIVSKDEKILPSPRDI